MGEENIKTLEKKKIEEKKAEKELENKIRNLKMTRNRERRPKPHEQDQPALKKRKTNMNGYKRVIQKPQSEGKRKDSEIEKEKETEKRIKEQLDKDRETRTPKKIRIITTETSEKEGVESESRWEKAWTQEEWDNKLKEREERIIKEEEQRQRKMREAKRK